MIHEKLDTEFDYIINIKAQINLAYRDKALNFNEWRVLTNMLTRITQRKEEEINDTNR